MTERDWYKGPPASATCLVFGEVFTDRPPNTAVILFGQEAYETYQTKAYLDGLLQIRHDPTYVDWSPLFSALYAGIVATGATEVVELGSTLFATIDKLDKLQRLSGGPSVAHLEFLGIEPSELFRQLAEALHPTARLRHVLDVSLATLPPRSVSRCYQASSYAFDATTDLVAYCAGSVFGSHGIWFSTDGTTRVVSGIGKPLTLFSLPEFLAGMATRGYRVEFVQRSRSRYADEFEFDETWLVYHRFTGDEDRSFRQWLAVFQGAGGNDGGLHRTFEEAPHRERAASGFSGLADDSRILDFTSPRALDKLAAWRRSVADAG